MTIFEEHPIKSQYTATYSTKNTPTKYELRDSDGRVYQNMIFGHALENAKWFSEHYKECVNEFGSGWFVIDNFSVVGRYDSFFNAIGSDCVNSSCAVLYSNGELSALSQYSERLSDDISCAYKEIFNGVTYSFSSYNRKNMSYLFYEYSNIFEKYGSCYVVIYNQSVAYTCDSMDRARSFAFSYCDDSFLIAHCEHEREKMFSIVPHYYHST